MRRNGHLTKDEEDALMAVFDEMPNVMLMDVVRLIENLIRMRRKDLTVRNEYCKRSVNVV